MDPDLIKASLGPELMALIMATMVDVMVTALLHVVRFGTRLTRMTMVVLLVTELDWMSQDLVIEELVTSLTEIGAALDFEPVQTGQVMRPQTVSNDRNYFLGFLMRLQSLSVAVGKSRFESVTFV
jgi:hypothetical protein